MNNTDTPNSTPSTETGPPSASAPAGVAASEPVLAPWENRLKHEYDDLLGKVTRLETFIESEAHAELSAIEQSALSDQLGHMRGYLEVLTTRIERLL